MIKNFIQELLADNSKREMFLQGKLNLAGVSSIQQRAIMETLQPEQRSAKDNVFRYWQ
ncbi:competence pheromone ComX [Paenibacillus taiwanensis]|uniref:competence pheromone ComX n=1 Tax=Paenibacillus taiwanensis TaxID=401638 RepID=UPI0004182B15|nr:competence pheromone ComX [Paenibacillus taiwanensis]